jgi:ankyrin repeat protein
VGDFQVATSGGFWVAIGVAAGNGDIEIMELLIKNSANVNQNDSQKNTPLMIASRNGHADAIELLMKSGSNINSKSKYYKKTALVYAAESGHFNCVKTLIAYGANEEINTALKKAELRLSGIPGADNKTKKQYRMIIELLRQITGKV